MCIGTLLFLVTLIVTYCPNKAGRQKKETPFPWGTLRPLPHKGLVIPLSLDAGPALQKQIRQISQILKSFFFPLHFLSLRYVYFIVVTIPLLLGKNLNGTALHHGIARLDLILLKSMFLTHLSKVEDKNLKKATPFIQDLTFALFATIAPTLW